MLALKFPFINKQCKIAIISLMNRVYSPLIEFEFKYWFKIKDIIVKDQRPVNLNLFTIRFPIPAIVSILHRISGIIVFLALPLLLWLFDRSLASEESFQDTLALLSNPAVKVVLWLIISSLIFHFVAGIRHLIMDLGWGEDLCAARASSYLVFISFIVLSVLVGIWLW